MKIVKPIIFRNFDFLRASEATYYDVTGALVTASADELRLGYNPTTHAFIGPIYEQASVNYIDSDLTNGTKWDEGSFTPISGVELDPTGTSTTVHGFSGNGFDVSPIESLYTVPPGDYTVSVYVTPASFGLVELGFDGGLVDVGVFDAAGSVLASPPNGSAHVQEVGFGWTRISISGTTTTGRVSLRVYGSLSDQSITGEVYFDFFQLEPVTANLLPTSFMVDTTTPPGGTLSFRAADETVEGPPQVVTSNVEENDAAQWDIDDTYTTGQVVMVLGSYHKLYESIGATPAGMFPPDHPEYWIDQGATNRWRMFDMTVGPEKQTVSTDSSNTVNVVLDFDQIVTSVTLLNMEANNVRIIMRDEFGNTVYDHYEDLLQETPSSDWWSFFFATRSNIKTLVLTDLPTVKPSTIEMILDGDAFPAKIGKMIVGEAVEVGCARYGTSVGIVDFSRKERDDFGNNFILERRYIDRADFDVQIPTSSIDSVKALLTSLRATPTLYIGDEQFASTVIYGFYRDFSIIISGPKRSDLTIQVESI